MPTRQPLPNSSPPLAPFAPPTSTRQRSTRRTTGPSAAARTSPQVELLGTAFRRAIAFASNEVERMVAEQDVGKAVRWVEVLRLVEEERIEWKM